MLRTSICESLWSLTHSNCVKFNQAALRAVLKPETMSSNAQTKQIPIRFVHVYKYASFYCRFRSFQSLFGSLFLLVSMAAWIYFNSLQNTAALKLYYFLWFKKHVVRTRNTNSRTLRLCLRLKYASFYYHFQSFQSFFGSLCLLVSIAVWIYFDYKTLQHWC